MTIQIHNNSQDSIKETPQALAQTSYTIAKNNVTTARKNRSKAHLLVLEDKSFPKFHKVAKKMEQVAKEVKLNRRLIVYKSEKIP